MGDPGGIGPEVLIKALRRLFCRDISFVPVVAGNREVLEHCGAADFAFKTVSGEEQIPFAPDTLYLTQPCDISAGSFKVGNTCRENGLASISFIEKALHMVRSGICDCLVTAPVSKESLTLAGVPFSGHTEIIARACNVSSYGMVLSAGNLKVFLVTRHIPFSSVGTYLTRERVKEGIVLSAQFLRDTGITSPRIGVASLNPHRGEDGMLGKEEKLIIAPAVFEAKQEGYCVEGPLATDRLFFDTAGGRYDMAVCMYHDQGLIPVKLLSFYRSINISVGFPFIRTSPCHGPGFDIAGRGKAHASSMEEAFIWAVKWTREHKERGLQ